MTSRSDRWVTGEGPTNISSEKPYRGGNWLGRPLRVRRLLRGGAGCRIRPSFLCGVAGIECQIIDNVAYLANWRRKIADKPQIVARVVSHAARAADCVLGRETERIQDDVTPK